MKAAGGGCVLGRRNRECRNLPTSQSKEVVRKWESLLRLDHRIKVGGDGAGEVGTNPYSRVPSITVRAENSI